MKQVSLPAVIAHGGRGVDETGPVSLTHRTSNRGNEPRGVG
jgi:hypothetical protein